MKEKVSEAQDYAFYRIGSFGLIAVLFATVIVIFAWLMQKPIDSRADNSVITGADRVAGAEIVNN